MSAKVHLWPIALALVTVLVSAAPPSQVRQTDLHALEDCPRLTVPAPIQATDGRLYGVLTQCPAAVYRLGRQGGFEIVHTFEPPVIPRGVMQASNGYFYGVTTGEGSDRGSVFRLDASGVFTVLHQFTEVEGRGPFGLIEADDGYLYGTTYSGGIHDDGTIYRMNFDGQVETLFHFEQGRGRPRLPSGPLLQASDGYLYGLTSGGGKGGLAGGGTLYRYGPNGVETIHSFDAHTTGANVAGSLAEGADGALYGVASTGGSYNGGTVYRVTREGDARALHAFNSRPGDDCYYPRGTVVADGAGNLFGVSAFRLGCAFRIGEDGSGYEQQPFSASKSQIPMNIMRASNGSFYGVAVDGGELDGGAIFRLTLFGR